jgi:FkbM family methyltransferase
MRNPIHSLGKRLARLRRFPAIGRRGGARFVLDPQNWIDNRLLAGAPYEDAQLALARRLIAERKIDLVIDIGANFGLYTVLLGLEPGVAEVHAFEPVRRNYNQLIANVFGNRLDAKVSAHRFALGEAAGAAAIHIDPRSTGVSRLDLAGAARGASVFTQRETIEVRRLDDVLQAEGRSVYVKIDVEGKAIEVLRGMLVFLSRNRGALQVEISPAETGAGALLESRGWQAAAVVEGDGFFVKD